MCGYLWICVLGVRRNGNIAWTVTPEPHKGSGMAGFQYNMLNELTYLKVSNSPLSREVEDGSFLF